jgi:hypothetical protein
MKISHFIFLVGIILLIIEVMILQSDLGSNSDNLVEGLVSQDVFDKIITLYFFIIVILFFFGGIVFFFEKGMKYPPSQYMEKPKHSLLKKRSTRSNPLM